MLNALVISNNINFVQTLLNELNSNRLEVRISGIVTDYSNVMELINSSNFKVVFVDDSVSKLNARAFFKTYKDMIVLLSYGSSAKLFTPKKLKLLRSIIAHTDASASREFIMSELVSIGYKRKYKGTIYLADAISHLLTITDKVPDNLTTDVYPYLSKKYSKSPSSLKSSMGKATEYMYYECDINILRQYFGFAIDTKPSVKNVIFTVLSKL